MTILKILQYPDSRLHRIANEVKEVNEPHLQKIIDDMLETLSNASNCAALAATQLDIENPPSITVINKTEDALPEQQPICLINPRITFKEGSKSEEEGCMSVYPQYISAIVKRATNIKVTALDRRGKPLEIQAEGLLARCIQHEVEHLQGVLYIDHLSSLKRSLIKKKIEKLQLKH